MGVYCTSHYEIDGLAKLYAVWTGKPPDWKHMLRNTYFVAARDTETESIVGATQYILVDDPFWCRRFALVENVYVELGYRKQGVGRMLMEFTEKQVRLFGCAFLKLTTRKDEGRALYRSLGYEEGSSFYKRW